MPNPIARMRGKRKKKDSKKKPVRYKKTYEPSVQRLDQAGRPIGYKGGGQKVGTKLKYPDRPIKYIKGKVKDKDRKIIKKAFSNYKKFAVPPSPASPDYKTPKLRRRLTAKDRKEMAKRIKARKLRVKRYRWGRHR